MTTITSTTTAVQSPFDDAGFDEAQMAAASFLARYSGRTLEAYRHDLRGFFQWAADHDVAVLPQPVRTSSCGAAGWKNEGSRRRQSTDGSRQCAGSTGSPTSTVGSARTRPSTFAARRSTPRRRADRRPALRPQDHDDLRPAPPEL